MESAFRLDADLLYLARLPELMSQVGVVGDGTVIASDQMRTRLRKEHQLSVTSMVQAQSGGV